MNKRIYIHALLLKAIFLFAFLSIQSGTLNGQSKYSSNNKIKLPGGRYHIKKGWINSVGFHVSPVGPIIMLAEIAEGIGQTLPSQFEYLGYQLVKPQLGLGVSVSYTLHPTSELGYEYFTHYKFIDVAGYTKLYLNSNGRGRGFLDLKLGYGIAHDNPIAFGCYGCSKVSRLYLRYSSGLMYQPGFGFDFATRTKIKWGFKFSISANVIKQQRDRHENGWETTDHGIIKRTRTDEPLRSLFFGFNVYL